MRRSQHYPFVSSSPVLIAQHQHTHYYQSTLASSSGPLSSSESRKLCRGSEMSQGESLSAVCYLFRTCLLNKRVMRYDYPTTTPDKLSALGLADCIEALNSRVKQQTRHSLYNEVLSHSLTAATDPPSLSLIS
jgi:hypothetical protein